MLAESSSGSDAIQGMRAAPNCRRLALQHRATERSFHQRLSEARIRRGRPHRNDLAGQAHEQEPAVPSHVCRRGAGSPTHGIQQMNSRVARIGRDRAVRRPLPPAPARRPLLPADSTTPSGCRQRPPAGSSRASMEVLGQTHEIVGGPSEALFQNVGLLFFNDRPTRASRRLRSMSSGFARRQATISRRRSFAGRWRRSLRDAITCHRAQLPEGSWSSSTLTSPFADRFELPGGGDRSRRWPTPSTIALTKSAPSRCESRGKSCWSL